MLQGAQWDGFFSFLLILTLYFRPGLLAPIAEDSPASAAAKETIMAKISNATKGMPRATLLSLAERLDDVLGKILSSSRV